MLTGTSGTLLGNMQDKQALKKLQERNAAVAADDSNIQRLLRQMPKYQNSLNSPEFAKLRGFAFSNAEDPVFAAQRASTGQSAEAQRARTRAEALAGLQSQEQSLAGQQANAYSQLAMGGGLSGGARERIAAGGLNTNLFAKQALRGEEQRGLTSIGTAEQESMGKLGVAEAQARQEAQGKITEALADEAKRRDSYNQDAWKMKAEVQGGLLKSKREQEIADQNAKAGSWLCNAVEEASGVYPAELTEGLELIRKYARYEDRGSYDLYMQRFPDVISAMQGKVDMAEFRNFIEYVAGLAFGGEEEKAYTQYKDKCIELISTYYPHFFKLEGAM